MAKKPTQELVDQFRVAAVQADLSFKNGNFTFAQKAIDAMCRMVEPNIVLTTDEQIEEMQKEFERKYPSSNQ